jgi:hypothetical protein
MNLAGQKGAHPGGVLVRVVEYRVDGGEVIRLLTDLMDPVAFPAGELAALYHQRWEVNRPSGRSRRFSAARMRPCGQRTRSWCARKYGRIWRCITA